MSINMKEVRYRFRETHKILMLVVILSVIGLVIEFIFACISSSMILYTDVVHWVVDTALEAVSLIVFFIISKVYRKFDWSIFILESVISILIVLTVFGLYIMMLIDYLSTYASLAIKPSTTNVHLAAVTTIGGIITFATFFIEHKAYKELRIEILKVDSTHAIIDVIASIIASIGIILTALTQNFIVELVVVFFVFFIAAQTLLNLIKDVFKSILGLESHTHLKVELITRLNSLVNDNASLGDIEIRKIGSIYIAKVEIYLDPNTTIDEAHRIRKVVNIICREVSDLIYHVDVVFLPKKKHKKNKNLKSDTQGNEKNSHG